MSVLPNDSPSAVSQAHQPLALVLSNGRPLTVSLDGEIETPSHAQLHDLIHGPGLLCVHVPVLWRRAGLKIPKRAAGLYDLAELFAFARPATFAAPTPSGLIQALGQPTARNPEEEALALHQLTDLLLGEIRSLSGEERAHGAAVLAQMQDWSWGPHLAPLLGAPPQKRFNPFIDLPEWEDEPSQGPPGDIPVEPSDALSHLHTLTTLAHAEPETRTTQDEYTKTATQIFNPREREDEPNFVVAEAGTGVGKTLGYLAPTQLWAHQNGGAVWVSTFTKNLQRQISANLVHLYPHPSERRVKTVIRKGRENYACLLNIQDALNGRLGPILTGLVLRWLRHTADGDMVGGDFPAWLSSYVPVSVRDQFGETGRLGLTDRRGECTYGACRHYRRCFIEHVNRRTKNAEIVVANHALILTRMMNTSPVSDDQTELMRLVIDEGHHIFDAADSAFSSHLTAQEMADLRRWLRGHEDTRRPGRGRTLAERVADLLPETSDANTALSHAMRCAAFLPGPDWPERVNDAPSNNPVFAFLNCLATQVRARADRRFNGFNLDCSVHPLQYEVRSAATPLRTKLGELQNALKQVVKLLTDRLDEEAATLDRVERGRLESAVHSLQQRVQPLLGEWLSMLASLSSDAPTPGVVDWFAIERRFGKEVDIGMHRHLIDPTKPLARSLYRPAHGVLITSATLLSPKSEDNSDERNPMTSRLGLEHLKGPALIKQFASPFDYANQAKVFVITDISPQQTDQIGTAMRVLFQAAGGGGLGLFTAIHRLKSVYKQIRRVLEESGIPVLSQHIDDMDTGTLVDTFRAELNSCLLGTDAVRDGVDVPGRALRLIVFERTPWPQPSLLHKARRAEMGGKAYDEALATARIAQGFGRLIRHRKDKGAFVILGAQTPTRLLAGLPSEIEVARTGLSEAAQQIKEFLAENV